MWLMRKSERVPTRDVLVLPSTSLFFTHTSTADKSVADLGLES